MGETPMAGGRRRIDRVLSPAFTEGLEALGDDDVRTRRDLARAERDYLSFVRRLLQGRADILRDELERRRRGEEPPPMVDRLVSVLSEGGRGPSRGEVPTVAVSDEELSLARRRVERLISDARLTDLEGMSDDELADAVATLDREERDVSDVRRKVIDVHDRLQDEVKRRLSADMRGSGQ